jgi:hypothetical protein
MFYSHETHAGATTAHDDGKDYSFFARLRVSKIYAFVRLLFPSFLCSRTERVWFPSCAKTSDKNEQDGFGDVSFIGWIPHDLYVSSGSKARSEKEVHEDWPVPRQPDEGVVLDFSRVGSLFGESSVSGDVEREEESFLRVQ